MKGKLLTTTNKEPKFGGALEYHSVLVRHEKAWKTLLITDSELKTIFDRSEKNPEDHLKPSWWDTLCSWFPFFD